MGPHDSSVVYAALNRVNILWPGNHNFPKAPGGLYVPYVTTDGGDSWGAVILPENVVGVNHVSIDRVTGALYIAAGEATGDVGSGGAWRRLNSSSNWQKLFFMPFVLECYARLL
jgi:hypothetical protein